MSSVKNLRLKTPVKQSPSGPYPKPSPLGSATKPSPLGSASKTRKLSPASTKKSATPVNGSVRLNSAIIRDQSEMDKIVDFRNFLTDLYPNSTKSYVGLLSDRDRLIDNFNKVLEITKKTDDMSTLKKLASIRKTYNKYLNIMDLNKQNKTRKNQSIQNKIESPKL